MSDTVNISVQETVENVTVTVNEVSEVVNISIAETTEQVNLTVSDNTTVVIPTAFDQRVVDLENSWYHYATLVEYNGTETVIATGDVLECVYDGSILYRYITTAESVNGYPLEDSFYTGFDGTNLTGLIVSR